MTDLTGIQTRTTTDGEVRYRGRVKDRGKWVAGPWRPSLADARGDRIRMQAKKLDGPLRQTDSRTVQAESTRFLEGIRAGLILSRKEEPYAPSTVRAYEQAFRDWINPELGHIPVATLRRDQVQRWVDWMKSQRQSGTVRNTWAALAALYSWLLPRNYELADPTDGVRLPRPGKPRERYAEPEEMRQLVEALPLELALPYALAFFAGLRRAEIQALRWEDVEGEWIVVRRALDPQEGYKTPKSGHAREIPIFETLGPYLEPRGQGLVLPSRRQSRWGAQMLGRPFTLRCEEHWRAAGLEPIGLHEGRHSFATALIRAGYDVTLVQEWMGHADPTTTLRVYAKKRGRQDGLTEKMNAYMIGAR